MTHCVGREKLELKSIIREGKIRYYVNREDYFVFVRICRFSRLHWGLSYSCLFFLVFCSEKPLFRSTTNPYNYLCRTDCREIAAAQSSSVTPNPTESTTPSISWTNAEMLFSKNATDGNTIITSKACEIRVLPHILRREYCFIINNLFNREGWDAPFIGYNSCVSSYKTKYS